MTADNNSDLLRPPSKQDFPSISRRTTSYEPLSHFDLAKGDLKHYQQQYGDMYFLRLARLKPTVERIASQAWEGYQIAGETVHRVERVLDVRQGELCWVAGTVYMDLPLKPNILDDIAKDHWISAPPTNEKYLSPDGQDKIMLEDESGRLRLAGSLLESELLVTGCIIAVMGTENADGEFEVIDLKFPDLSEQPKATLGKSHSSIDASNTEKGGKIAIVSGLNITGDSGESLVLDMLVEWLLGESTDSTSQESTASISRLLIAGNSLAEATPTLTSDDAQASGVKKLTSNKKYGYDSSAYNSAPSTQLDIFLSTLLPSIPITLIPGATDPANVSLPQQPLHPALFPSSRMYAAPPTLPSTDGETVDQTSPLTTGSFHAATNPASFYVSDRLFLGVGGQTIDDISKYVDPCSSIELMESTLRWRLVAPTAPDTLWCYPYQSDDPFVIREGQCPHIYFVGNQPSFDTSLIEGPVGQKVRCISVPKFSETGELALVDIDDLSVEKIKFSVV